MTMNLAAPIVAVRTSAQQFGAFEAKKHVGAIETMKRQVGAIETKKRQVVAVEVKKQQVVAIGAKKQQVVAIEAKRQQVGAIEAKKQQVGAIEAKKQQVGAIEAKKRTRASKAEITPKRQCPPVVPAPKKVRFDLKRNIFYKNEQLAREDFSSQWIGAEDIARFKAEFIQVFKLIAQYKGDDVNASPRKILSRAYESCCECGASKTAIITKEHQLEMNRMFHQHQESLVGLERLLVYQAKPKKDKLVNRTLFLQRVAELKNSDQKLGQKQMAREIAKISEDISRPARLFALRLGMGREPALVASRANQLRSKELAPKETTVSWVRAKELVHKGTSKPEQVPSRANQLRPKELAPKETTVSWVRPKELVPKGASAS